MPEVTGDHTPTDAEVKQYVASIVDERLKKTTTETVNPQELVLNVGGQEYKFKDAQDASAQLTSLYETTRQQQPVQQERRVTSDDGNEGWTSQDQSTYVDLLVKNPLKAAEYVDAKRYGVANPTEVMRNALQTTAGLASNRVIDNFIQANPDYYPSNENAAVLERMLRESYNNQLPTLNVPVLESAFARAEKLGLLKRPQGEENQRQTPAYNPYMSAPPVAGRSQGNVSPSFERDVESMSADQIQEMMYKLQG